MPEGPCVIVGNHNGGLSIVDGLFLVEYYRHFGFDKPIYILAHDIVFRFARLRRLMGQLGILRANPGQAERVLAFSRRPTDHSGTRQLVVAVPRLAARLARGDGDLPMGEIAVRPWRERSFYMHDPFGNPLCFVDEKTLFTGR